MLNPVIGRDADLVRLSQRVADASRRHSGIVVICGEAGIGKTRLVDEFCAQLPKNIALLRGAALDDGWMAPYHAWGEALDAPVVAATTTDLGVAAAVIDELIPRRRRATLGPPGAQPLGYSRTGIRCGHSTIAVHRP
jgi:hypothetical protein